MGVYYYRIYHSVKLARVRACSFIWVVLVIEGDEIITHDKDILRILYIPTFIRLQSSPVDISMDLLNMLSSLCHRVSLS